MDQLAIIGIAISALALLVSFASYWSATLRIGQILMTKPTIFFMGYDCDRPKLFLRCLLFSTAQAGRVLECLYINLRCSDWTACYSFWGHTSGDENKLTRGSGLYVGKPGLLANHHFNPLKDAGKPISFKPGTYEVTVICRQYGDTTDRKLGLFELTVDETMAKALGEGGGVLWTLDPQAQKYIAEQVPPRVAPSAIKQINEDLQRLSGLRS